MKVIFIDGGPASGKNTLGNLLVDYFLRDGFKSVLLDLDGYVERYCPDWRWGDDRKRIRDINAARTDLIRDINSFLQRDFCVIVIGDRFMTQKEIDEYAKKLPLNCPKYLYHLNPPLAIRKQRLHDRGPHSLIDIDNDQQERDAILLWPGFVYQNVDIPEEDAKHLYTLIRTKKGLIKLDNI